MDTISHSSCKNRQTMHKHLVLPTMWRGAEWLKGKGTQAKQCSFCTGWNLPPGVHPRVATLSSVEADRWPKAGWLPFWPPLLSGGTAGPTLGSWPARGPGYPDPGSRQGKGVSEKFRAGPEGLGQGFQVCYRFGRHMCIALVLYVKWTGLQTDCCLLNKLSTAGCLSGCPGLLHFTSAIIEIYQSMLTESS